MQHFLKPTSILFLLTLLYSGAGATHATSSTYDALNRLTQTNILAANDPDHAQIGYSYDERDNLAQSMGSDSIDLLQSI